MGENILDRIKESAKYGKHALIVTGRSFAAKTGLLGRAEAMLKDAGVRATSFCDVEPEPGIETVEKGAEACRKAGCDMVVGIGGGSAMDTAKAIAVLASNTGNLREYFGEDKFPNDPLPVIAIPTTAGTGSEAARYAVIVDWSIPGKKTIASHRILPKMSILDPLLTLTLTKELTVFTGMDAFSHALEGFLSTGADRLSDLFAIESMKIINKSLPGAIKEPAGIEQRGNMLYASMLAGFVINRAGTIIVHGMAYPLALKYKLQHGQSNAMLLGAAVDLLYGHYRDKLEKLNSELGGDVRDMIKKLIACSGIPFTLSSAGVKKEDIGNLSADAVASCERAMKRMKIKLGVTDFCRIYEKAFK